MRISGAGIASDVRAMSGVEIGTTYTVGDAPDEKASPAQDPRNKPAGIGHFLAGAVLRIVTEPLAE
jgi:hypothetical protein